MDFILGSGVVGYLAKKIFDWHIVPFKRSRYYAYTPYVDNYIIVDNDVDGFINSFRRSLPIITKSSFSFKGRLISDDQTLRELYVNKAYDNNPHPGADKVLKTVMSTYDISVKQIHDMLYQVYIDDINSNIKKFGDVVSIDVLKKEIVFKNSKMSYDNIISTIPLDMLCKLTGHCLNLPCSDLYVYHLASDAIDIEGCMQCYVCDDNIDFYKVQKVDAGQYLLWCNHAIEQPYKYFGLFFGYDFDIVEIVKIENAIPLGAPPDLSYFNNNNIICVGSNAQWDDFMDVSSCIKRLFRYKNNQLTFR